MIPMIQVDRRASGSSHRAWGVACVVMLLCVCVVTQMLGIPTTLIGLLNSDMLTKSEPVSEDVSALSPSPEAEEPDLLSLFIESQPVRHFPVLLTSVFRPPST